MPYIAYEDWDPQPKTMAVVTQAREIIDEYRVAGYLLTLRQLYYQFVSRDLIRNTQRDYKRLGDIVAKARLAGLIDWEAIEDRTRNLTDWLTYSGPEEAIARARHSYTLEKWERQPSYVEVWVEKEALAGVFERICSELEVPFFANRGYVSLSEMWAASQRLRAEATKDDPTGRVGWDNRPAKKQVVILHFGDHDPSGIDMTRDIDDRTELFMGYDSPAEVWRIALNMDQVDEYGPPPNPAKLSDSRAGDYVARFGESSWELDALEPSVLSELVRQNVDLVRDADLWEEAEAEEEEHRATLDLIRDHYAEVAQFVRGIAP